MVFDNKFETAEYSRHQNIMKRFQVSINYEIISSSEYFQVHAGKQIFYLPIENTTSKL